MQTQSFLKKQNNKQNESFTISQVARMTGINAKAIRYYEGIGLLPSPSRSANQYRRYSMADMNRLILLRRIRYLGVPLPTGYCWRNQKRRKTEQYERTRRERIWYN